MTRAQRRAMEILVVPKLGRPGIGTEFLRRKAVFDEATSEARRARRARGRAEDAERFERFLAELTAAIQGDQDIAPDRERSL